MSRMPRVGSLAIAASLLIATMGVALAADPSPPLLSSASPAPSHAPLPDLTMAPLVTLPPVSHSRLGPRDLPSDGYAYGEPDAPVTIDAYQDFQCPYCQRFSLLVAPQVIDAWVRTRQARLVFHDFAFLGEESRWAAVAARLAADQDRFWPFHDLLFSNLLGENVGSFTPDRLLLMGQMAGLDMDPFIAGLQVPAARASWAIIDQEVREAAATLGISGTPTVFVDGVKVASPDAASIGTAVQAALAVHEAAVPTNSPIAGSPTPTGSIGP